MGGSDDGTGTGQAANIATDHDLEDGSVAEGIETAVAENAAETAETSANCTPGQQTTVISEENTAYGDGTTNAKDTDGARETGSARARRKGGALSSPNQASVDPEHDAEAATAKPKAAAAASLAVTPDVGNRAASSPLPGAPAREGSRVSGMIPSPANGVPLQLGTAATQSLAGSPRDAAPGGSIDGEEKYSKSGRGRPTPGSAGNESKAMEGSGGSARLKDDHAPKNAASPDKKESGVEGLLERTVSHTVDCLIYIKWCVREEGGDSSSV